ncbi:Endopolyphosphatase [Pleurostoma richardsiae]|uniref:Endopolyphosphatase n=1 Tax=Pleurostoma richardsiae TaxID=41990 RepID=A0AA38R735_9PEZI|nr:Endopolyphosphatase [Pleurostoma richardsiae]
MAQNRPPWLWLWFWLSRLMAAGFLCHGVIAGPLRAPVGLLHQTPAPQIILQPPPPAASARRKLHGRFLHITDLHPDEFYKIHSSTGEETACHRGVGPAGTYGAETSDCDSPFSLINATFDWIAANVADDIDFVIWTGDSARHDSDEEIPRSPSQVLGTNRWISSKFSEVFANPDAPLGGPKRGLAVPIVPTLGNNDILPHNILLPGPNKWLQYYTDIWREFIPEEQRHSFEFGGWFYVEVIPNELAVFSLNTLYFFDRNAGVDDCAQPSEPGFKQMEWLRIQLQFMRQRGMKAILMGHVPPARTESKQLWHESCWQKYTLWLQQYRDVVVGAVYGHMNIDHFLLQDTHEIDILPGQASTNEIFSVRESMEDELAVESAADYLQELRDKWAELPRPAILVEEASATKKKKKHKGTRKKRLGPWAERYQLSLVGPSVVPNYFPTLRVLEYNISGLEDAATWADVAGPLPIVDDLKYLKGQQTLELRDLAEVSDKKRNKGVEQKKPKKPKKHEKKKTPKDPNLIVPDPPARSSPPGPAYSPQPLTLVGYTQYYANLTRINNDMVGASELEVDRWREGKHRDKKPSRKPAKPLKFEFEVEYSTFKDTIYNVTDLTVNSFVQLAYRMGRDKTKSKTLLSNVGSPLDGDATRVGDVDGLQGISSHESQVEHETFVELKANTKNGNRGGGKNRGKPKAEKKDKKKTRRKHNKTWLHFLQHAFVSTVEEEELKQLSD